MIYIYIENNAYDNRITKRWWRLWAKALGEKIGETNKEADKQKREAVDARNQADSIIFSTEKDAHRPHAQPQYTYQCF